MAGILISGWMPISQPDRDWKRFEDQNPAAESQKSKNTRQSTFRNISKYWCAWDATSVLSPYIQWQVLSGELRAWMLDVPRCLPVSWSRGLNSNGGVMQAEFQGTQALTHANRYELLAAPRS